jgi:hypothetical protein
MYKRGLSLGNRGRSSVEGKVGGGMNISVDALRLVGRDMGVCTWFKNSSNVQMHTHFSNRLAMFHIPLLFSEST